MAKKHEVAVLDREPTAVATPTLNFAEDAGQFAPEFRSDELAMPFLRILQDLSPQVKDRDPAYVPGAKPGDWYEVVGNKVTKGPLTAVVVAFHRKLVEWKPRKDGGGFVAEHPFDEVRLRACVKNEKNEFIEPGTGHALADTQVYYLLLLDSDGSTREAVLPLVSTQLKKARMWNSLLRGKRITDNATGRAFTPPLFYSVFSLTTKVESNDKGEWFGLAVEPAGDVTTIPNGASVYLKARELAALIKSGERQVKVQGAFDMEFEEAEEEGDASDNDVL